MRPKGSKHGVCQKRCGYAWRGGGVAAVTAAVVVERRWRGGGVTAVAVILSHWF